MRVLGLVAIFFPLFGAFFGVLWSILYDYEASVRTACRVRVYLHSFLCTGSIQDVTVIRVTPIVGHLCFISFFLRRYLLMHK